MGWLFCRSYHVLGNRGQFVCRHRQPQCCSWQRLIPVHTTWYLGNYSCISQQSLSSLMGKRWSASPLGSESEWWDSAHIQSNGVFTNLAICRMSEQHPSHQQATEPKRQLQTLTAELLYVLQWSSLVGNQHYLQVKAREPKHPGRLNCVITLYHSLSK